VLVVAAAIIADGRVLVAQRNHPPALAGRWEFPGGRVRSGESPSDALVRECREELGIRVQVGRRLGGTALPHTGSEPSELWLFACVTDHRPAVIDHAELRWVTTAELDDLAWLPADRQLLPPVARRLVTDPAAEPRRESRIE
jgi:8-oxo-dGTP diphosphatase